MVEEIKFIPLSGKDAGKFAIIEACFYEEFMKRKWFLCNGYASRTLKKNKKAKKLYMHRLIMGSPVGMHVDHIDGNPLNNVRSNLRVCTHKENLRNCISRIGTSKYKGVHWSKVSSKWASAIIVDGKKKHLGVFHDEIEAAKTYDLAAVKHFGEFARLNFGSGEYHD